MGCTGKTWVEGVNYLQNFKWFVCNFYMCINHSIFVCAMFICCSLRARIPCRWDDTLVICRATIFNMNPVTQATSRRIYKTNTFCVLSHVFGSNLVISATVVSPFLILDTSLLKKYWLIFAATCASRPRHAVRPTIVVIHT